MYELVADDLKAIFSLLSTKATEQKDYLIALDGAMGDGDLGLTMATGFAKASETLVGSTETRLGKLFRAAGETFAETVPSTMGTLLASAFMRAGKAVAESDRAGTAELARIFSGMVDGIAARGKSKVGEKTILDVLSPAAEALHRVGGKDLPEALTEAAQAAATGFEAARHMVATHGRAAFYGEQTLGKPDPGSAVGLLIVQTFAEYVQSRAA